MSYAKHVRPFLAKYCLECHNAKSAKLGLNLETVKAIREGSDGGSVLEPGKPDESRIVLLVEGKDKPPMPPPSAKFHPKKEEIGVLRAWIASGAKDDSAEIRITLPDIKPRRLTPGPVAALAYSPTGFLRANVLYAARHGKVAWYFDGEGDPNPHAYYDKVSAIAPLLTKRGASTAPPCLAVALGEPGRPGTVDLLLRNPRTGSGPLFQSLPIKHADSILDMAIDPNGRILATCSYDTQIKICDLGITRNDDPSIDLFDSAKVLFTLKEHSDAVYGVAFSPDGKQLASCSADRAVKVFDVTTGKLLYTLGEATDWLYTVAWSPDGQYLAAGGVDKSIRVYSPGPQGAKLLHSVFAHQEPVQKILFSKDSKSLYSLGQGGTLKSWNVERMVERTVYDRQPETVLCMALRPDGKQIALGRYDGVVVLLDEATGKVQAQIGAAQPEKKQPPLPEKKAAPQIKQVNPAAVGAARRSRSR